MESYGHARFTHYSNCPRVLAGPASPRWPVGLTLQALRGLLIQQAIPSLNN
jgi:hypothetical protein